MTMKLDCELLLEYIHAVPDLYFLVSEDGTILDAEHADDVPTYKETEESIGSTIRKTMPSATAEVIMEGISGCITSGKPVRIEYELELPYGPRHYECRLKPVSGKREAIAVIRDITEIDAAFLSLAKSERIYRELIEKAPIPILIVRKSDGTVRYANRWAVSTYSYMTQNLIGTPLAHMYQHPEDRLRLLDRLEKQGFVANYELAMLDTEGNPFWSLVSAANVEFEGGPATMIAINDITRQKAADAHMRKSEEKYRMLTEFNSDVVWVYNVTQDRLTYMSPAVFRLRGYTPDEAMAQPFFESICPDCIEPMRERIRKMVQAFNDGGSDDGVIIETRLLTKDGKRVWVEMSLRLRRNEDMEVEVVGVSRNIDKRKKAEADILYLSYNDQLTGLNNRRYFVENYETLNREENLPLTMVFADLNGLKFTNDVFGHAAGDKLLVSFAEILRKSVRPRDMLARVGGDEFIVVLVKTDENRGRAWVAELESRISAASASHGLLSVSLGTKTKRAREEKFDEIYKFAEDMMYRQKAFDRQRFKSDLLYRIKHDLFAALPQERDHSDAVARLCRMLGLAMGMTTLDVEELELAGALHDIGKIGVDRGLLDKAGPLDASEREEIERHAEIGYRILETVEIFSGVGKAILHHHERIDGRGYPQKLRQNEIPIKSRIIAVAEAYDAMVRNLSRHKPMTSAEAIRELKKNAGTQFDVDVVRAFADDVATRIG